MGRTAPFHDLNAPSQVAPRYHTNSACTRARNIPQAALRPGSGGYYVCEECARLHQQEEASPLSPRALTALLTRFQSREREPETRTTTLSACRSTAPLARGSLASTSAIFPSLSRFG